MGRKRQYANNAERVKACRARKAQQQMEPALEPASPPSKVKQKAKIFRPARALALENEAKALSAEYQVWRDKLPESLQDGDIASKLDEAIEQFAEIAEMVAAIDLPRGYGHD